MKNNSLIALLMLFLSFGITSVYAKEEEVLSAQ